MVNAHPHVSGNCTISASGPAETDAGGVHNGSIEYYAGLQESLPLSELYHGRAGNRRGHTPQMRRRSTWSSCAARLSADQYDHFPEELKTIPAKIRHS